MRHAAVPLLSFVLSVSATAQDFPGPTEAGTRALDSLVARCVAAGGLSEARDPRLGKTTLTLVDAAKVKQAVVDAHPENSALLRDSLVARWKVASAAEQGAVLALLRAVGEASGDGLASAFAGYFEGVGLQGRDPDAAFARIGTAATTFGERGELTWQAACLTWSGVIRHGMGRYREALAFHEKALGIRLEALGPRHPDVAQSYNNIANAHGSLGEPARALASHEQALAIRLEALGPRHPDVARSYGGIANAHADLGDPAKSIRSHEKSLEIFVEALGPRHPDVATCYNNIANAHVALGEPARAIELHEKALAIRLEALAPRHADVAQSYNNIANARADLGELAEAIASHEKALAIRLEALGPRHPDVATSYDGIASAHYALGATAKALEGFEKALAIRLGALGPRHHRVAASYSNVASAHIALGEPARALGYYEKSLAIFVEVLGPRHPFVAQCYNNIASAHSELAEPARALGYYEKSLAIFVEALGPRHPLVAASYNNIANAHVALGEPARAIELHEKALAIRLEALGPRHADVAQSYNNIASAHDALGEPVESLKYHEKALAILVGVFGPGHPSIAVSHNNLGSACFALGDPAKALVYFESALAIYLEAHGPRHPDVAMSHFNIANAHRSLGDPAKALVYFESALAIYLEAHGPRHPDVAASYNNISTAQAALGDPARVIGSLDRALDALIEPDGATPPPPGGVQHQLRPLPLTVEVLIKRAKLRDLLRKGDQVEQEEMADLLTAADLLDRLRGPAATPGRGETTAADRLHQGEVGADLAPLTVGVAARLAEAGRDPARLDVAFAAAERGAARVFLQDLGRAHAASVGRVDPARLDEERRLEIGLREVDLRIDRVEAVAPEKRDVEAVRVLLKERREAERERGELVARMERDFPQYAAMKYPRPCTKEKARASLDGDEVALSFVPGEEASYLIVLQGGGGPGEIAVHKLPRAAEIADRVAALLQPRVLGDSDATRERGAELYRMLLAPAAGAIAGKPLVVVPGGPLGQLPFELLVEPDGAGGEGRFLVQGHRIRYAPSLTALHMIGLWEAQRARPERALFALGDPIYAAGDARLAGKGDAGPSPGPVAVLAGLRGPRGEAFGRLAGAGAEVARIAGLMGGEPGDRLVGPEATEAALARLSAEGTLARYRYVHFATHGVLGAAGGTPPGLVLSLVGNPAGVDGYLRLDEVTTLKLNADLVVLSACQTGQGRVFKAEGVSGLARAFLYAGSRAVLCSLWQVDDAATAGLMADTYAGLKEGRPAADALRAAQLKMIAADEPPAHWAPFILIGR